jgi:hypothetical protein
MTDPNTSNSLTDLAARIRIEHEAIAASFKRGAAHAMAAGDLLTEAKAIIRHGDWLPWLKANCEVSERTARLYMRLARNRSEIEAKTATVADLNLRGALALISPPADNSLVSLGDGIAESADRVSDIVAYEKAEAERIIRKEFFDSADAGLRRIIELGEAHPTAVAAAEAAWGIFGDALMAAINEAKNVLESDMDVPFACSPQATTAADEAAKLIGKMLRHIEAA